MPLQQEPGPCLQRKTGLLMRFLCFFAGEAGICFALAGPLGCDEESKIISVVDDNSGCFAIEIGSTF